MTTIPFPAQTARYIRVTQTGSASGIWWSIHEFNVYQAAYALNENSANGSVIFDPLGGTYLAGTAVTVTAVPDSGYAFTGWGGELSGTTNPNTIIMDGNRSLIGGFSPVPDPFTAWAGVGVNFVEDSNNDGLANGLAWLLGAGGPNDSASSRVPVFNPTAGSLKMSFDMLPASARDGARLVIEHSSDLGRGDAWSVGVLVPDATASTTPVSFVVSDSDLGDPTNPLDVEATISATEAATGKLFGRLKAVR